MPTKTCTKCGIDKEVCADNFHWDKRLYKGIGGFVSACKICKNKNKPQNSRDRRNRLYALGIKEHIAQYQKHKERALAYAKKKEVIEHRKVVVRKRYANNPTKFLDYKKEYVEKNKQKCSELQRKRDKKSIDTMDDAYIAKLSAKFFPLSATEIRTIPYLVETYRVHLKIKRLIGYNNPPLQKD